MSSKEQTKRTPLYQAHLDAGAKMTDFGGWEMPLSYEGQLAEHHAVRHRAGMFDVSHMGQIRFTGEGAREFLDYLLPANIGSLPAGKSCYTQLCNEDGGVIDDLIVSHMETGEYFAVVNAATKDNDFQWMVEVSASKRFTVSIEDLSEWYAMIAIQGPEALALLEKLVPEKKWSETAPFTIHQFDERGKHHLISRTGYTGERGAELLCPPEYALDWWKRLVDAGIPPCGLAARDTLRLEAGYPLYGQDLSLDITPVEAKLSWSIGWKKESDFIGRAALEKQREEKPAKTLIGLVAQDRRPIRAHDKIHVGEREVGEVTSGGFSPILNAGIALGYVEREMAKNEEFSIVSRSKPRPAAKQKPPFVKTSLSK